MNIVEMQGSKTKQGVYWFAITNYFREEKSSFSLSLRNMNACHHLLSFS